MPFVREIVPAGDVRAGIWHITEPHEELLDLVRLTEAETVLYGSFRHELRKKQWLACRALVNRFLYPASPAISYDPNGKPFLISGSHHLSVSHAGDYAAAVFSRTGAVGIDIEKIGERIERVKERFLFEGEIASLCPEYRLEQLYIYWCGKEALYKLNGRADLDFRNDIRIHPIPYLCEPGLTGKATLMVDGSAKDYDLYYEKTGNYMVAIAW